MTAAENELLAREDEEPPPLNETIAEAPPLNETTVEAPPLNDTIVETPLNETIVEAPVNETIVKEVVATDACSEDYVPVCDLTMNETVVNRCVALAAGTAEVDLQEGECPVEAPVVEETIVEPVVVDEGGVGETIVKPLNETVVVPEVITGPGNSGFVDIS